MDDIDGKVALRLFATLATQLAIKELLNRRDFEEMASLLTAMDDDLGSLAQERIEFLIGLLFPPAAGA